MINQRNQKLHFVCEEFGIQPAQLQRLNGYSNENYEIIDTFGNKYILRKTRKNRSHTSILAEAHVLHGMTSQKEIFTPRLIHYAFDPETQSYFHLFEKSPGEIPCFWWQQCTVSQLIQIFEKLATLHQAMFRIPPRLQGDKSCQRSVCDFKPLDPTPINLHVTEHLKQFYENGQIIENNLKTRFSWERARYQWIHGDVHLENVLFQSDRLTSIIDFELASWGSCEQDAILSAFRVSRKGNSDDPFQYDKKFFEIAIETYLRHNDSLCLDFFQDYETLWKSFFCFDQACLYLNHAVDDVWQLEPNSGFLPCFNYILNYD